MSDITVEKLRCLEVEILNIQVDLIKKIRFQEKQNKREWELNELKRLESDIDKRITQFKKEVKKL